MNPRPIKTKLLRFFLKNHSNILILTLTIKEKKNTHMHSHMTTHISYSRDPTKNNVKSVIINITTLKEKRGTTASDPVLQY